MLLTEVGEFGIIKETVMSRYTVLIIFEKGRMLL